VIGQNARFLRSSLLPLIQQKYTQATGVSLAGYDNIDKTLADIHRKLLPQTSLRS